MGASALEVVVLAGSSSDQEFIDATTGMLERLGISHEARVLSAHRQADALEAYLVEVHGRGVKVFICMAGMAAHLPGVVASKTDRPVLGVPLKGGILDGLDALLSVVQMPKGVPVGCVAVGKAGARNAAVLALQILALADESHQKTLKDYRAGLAEGKA